MAEYQEIRVGDEIIRFPADMSDEEISKALSSYQAEGGSGTPEAMAHGVMDGMTLGSMDNIEAFGQSLANLLGGSTVSNITGREGSPDTSSYKENLDWIRSQNKQIKEKSPVGDFIGELLGGILTGGAGAARVAGKKTFKEAIPLLAGLGAGYGGAAGLGHGDAESFGEGARDAATGAVFGAPMGVALPGAMAGGRAALNRLSPLPKRASESKLSRDLEQTGMSDAEINAKLDEDPNMILADTSPILQQRLGEAVHTSPKAAREVVPALEERVAGLVRGLGSYL